MRITFLGTGEFAVQALQSLHEAGHDIRCAISQPDRPSGRGRQVEPTPVHRAADRLGIPHLQTPDVNALPLPDCLQRSEIGVVVAFGQKISPAILNALPLGCVNIHGSLLPRHRGAAPYQWAILCGDAETGVTAFQLNENWDAGAVWDVRRTPIHESETADELHDRLAILGGELIVTVLQQIERHDTPRPQDSSQATRAPKLKKQDGIIDWSQAGVEIARRINGLWSWPTAIADFISRSGKRERVQLARARGIAATAAEEWAPGRIRDDGRIQCGRGTIEVLEIRPAGRALMTFQAFANGRHLAAGDRFEVPAELA